MKANQYGKLRIYRIGRNGPYKGFAGPYKGFAKAKYILKGKSVELPLGELVIRAETLEDAEKQAKAFCSINKCEFEIVK